VEAADVRAPLLCISLLHQKKTTKNPPHNGFQGVLQSMSRFIAAALLLEGVLGGAGGHITWLPLGDSITWGCGNGVEPHDPNGGCEEDAGSYRIPVAQALEQWNVSVTTVGTRFAGPASQPDAWKHHEGHPGWRTSQIEAISANWTTFNPDIITILLGTNDLKSTPSSILADMDRLLNTTRTTLPNAMIFVASILDVPSGQKKANQVGLNKGLPDVVRKWGANGMVHYVPLAENTTGVCGDDKHTFSIGDGVHPNAMGHLRVAAVFARSITQVICPDYHPDRGCAPQLSPSIRPRSS
jgi:lysophospholipase L1-like esterase